jgi:hypothetical protein
MLFCLRKVTVSSVTPVRVHIKKYRMSGTSDRDLEKAGVILSRPRRQAHQL